MLQQEQHKVHEEINTNQTYLRRGKEIWTHKGRESDRKWRNELRPWEPAVVEDHDGALAGLDDIVRACLIVQNGDTDLKARLRERPAPNTQVWLNLN